MKKWKDGNVLTIPTDEAGSQAKADEFIMTCTTVRATRDGLLAESDQHVLLDRIGLEQPTDTTFDAWLAFMRGIGEMASGEWAVYRQALRDVPQQSGFPFDVHWPEIPEG